MVPCKRTYRQRFEEVDLEESMIDLVRTSMDGRLEEEVVMRGSTLEKRMKITLSGRRAGLKKKNPFEVRSDIDVLGREICNFLVELDSENLGLISTEGSEDEDVETDDELLEMGVKRCIRDIEKIKHVFGIRGFEGAVKNRSFHQNSCLSRLPRSKL